MTESFNCINSTLVSVDYKGVPNPLAIPLLGYVGSPLSCLCILKNILLLMLLWPKNKPSNRILCFIVISDILSILPMIPWWIYFYTFGYYHESIESVTVCYFWYYMNFVSSVMFHLAAKLFTVYLAFQRWVHVR